MAFLRRGTVRVPHKQSKSIFLQRINGTMQKIFLKDISCWEEHQLNEHARVIVLQTCTGSSIPVAETFEHIEQRIDGSAVQP